MEQDKNKRMDELFKQARTQAPKTSFEKTKFAFTTNLENGRSSTLLSKLKSFKTLLIMTLSAIILGISLITINNSTNESKPEVITKNETKTSIVSLEIIRKVEPKTAQLTIKEKKNNLLKDIQQQGIKVDKNKNKVRQQKEIANIIKNDTNDKEFEFPVLTKKQKEDNEKQKNIMLKGLARYNRMPAINNIDERIYPMVYWNKLLKVGKASSIDATNAFHIKNTEVTNLEYRTFLFDLLIQGKNDLFLKAKPNQELWLEEYPKGYEKEAKFMKDNYFSNPEYNDYPIVAISREGAELYCKWLTEERNNLNPEKYGTLVNVVRLPNAKEWVQAAKGRSVSPIYSSGKELKNSEGCYLVNFMPGKNTTTKCIENNNENAYGADGGFHTVKAFSYNPNGSGLYNMSGNVAEMVYYEDENNVAGTKGGSWMSNENELQIEGEDPFKGKLTASISVGFRPVITYVTNGACKISDDAYRFPNLSPRQKEENDKLKTKMIKELSKFDKKKYAFIPSGEATIKNKIINVNAFYMQNTEVSNLEYRTFLYDLLIQDRKDDFLIAKPDQSQWTKLREDLRPMEEFYFSNIAYNDYPVNNISKAGVELYCKWLNEEQTKLFGKTMNDVRLPTSEEWMYAAKGGLKNFLYPWNMSDIKNSRGCYQANFYPIEEGHNADELELTGKVDSYSPNNFGLYCMSGNVAEMVIDNDDKLIAKGGGWNSIGEQLQIEADNDFENAGEPNPEIGFRIVISDTNDRK